MLGVVGLLCMYNSKVIGWERLIPNDSLTNFLPLPFIIMFTLMFCNDCILLWTVNRRWYWMSVRSKPVSEKNIVSLYTDVLLSAYTHLRACVIVYDHITVFTVVQLLTNYVDSVDMITCVKRHLMPSQQRLTRWLSRGGRHWSPVSPITFTIITINSGRFQCMAARRQRATLRWQHA